MHIWNSGHNLFVVLVWCFEHQPTCFTCLWSGQEKLFFGGGGIVLAIKPPALPARFTYLRLPELKVRCRALKGTGGTHTSVSSSPSLLRWLSEADRKSSNSSSDSGRNMSGRRVWDFFSNFEAPLVNGLTPSPPPSLHNGRKFLLRARLRPSRKSRPAPPSHGQKAAFIGYCSFSWNHTRKNQHGRPDHDDESRDRDAETPPPRSFLCAPLIGWKKRNSFWWKSNVHW